MMKRQMWPDATTPTPPRVLPCGCCTGGCVCRDHGKPPLICAHHREHGRIDEDHRMPRRAFVLGFIASAIAAGLPLPVGLKEAIDPVRLVEVEWQPIKFLIRYVVKTDGNGIEWLNANDAPALAEG